MNFFDILNHEGMIVISNKSTLKPAGRVVAKKWNGYGWGDGSDTGYEFKQFLADTYYFLGEFSKLEGIQQLIN